MRPSEIIDRERRWAPFAAIAAFGVLATFIAAILIQSGIDAFDADSEIERLEVYEDNKWSLLASAVLNAFSFALIAPALAYLFSAAAARSDRVRGALIGVTVAGPLFFAAAVVIQALVLDSIAADFVGGDSGCANDDENCVEDLFTEDSLFSVAVGLSIAGRLGLGIGLVYTCLWAMRTGLMTRFLGTFGMAVGVISVIFNPLFAFVFMVGLGLLYLGWVPRGRPPAWEAGEAIPWPPPGRRPEPPEEDEEVEGRASEVFPDAAADEDDESGDEPETKPTGSARTIEEEVDRATTGEDGPQKRKRRS